MPRFRVAYKNRYSEVKVLLYCEDKKLCAEYAHNFKKNLQGTEPYIEEYNRGKWNLIY